MRRAIELARDSVRRGGGPFGAVVVRDGTVIAEGQNRVVPEGDPTAHAEVCAIRNACSALGTHELHGCEIYSSCEPCPMCLAAIHWARLERIHYACNRDDAARIGFDDALLYAELPKPPAERRTPAREFLREEGLVVFEEWDADPDKAMY